MAKAEIRVEGIDVLESEIEGIVSSYFTDTAWRLFNDAEYAQYVELGTWKMRAQPFMGPGLESAARNFNAIASRNDSSTEAIVQGVAEAARDGAYARCPVDTGYLRSRIQLEKVV